ncbi:MAG TPA: YadA-like family protein [Paraburkholderia sp.]|nr:YadA-like family protein [Paraburkholderia sp.]
MTKGLRVTSIALGIAALSAAAPAFASAVANADCTPANAGSGKWSNVSGCDASAGAFNAAHNLAETVYGSNGYVPQNVSFASIFGFGGQVRAYYGTALGAAAYVSNTAQNSVALGTGSVASEANTVSLGRVGDSPLKGTYTDNGDGTSADATPFNQSLAGTLTRRLTNMSAGINNTDAVNVGQLKAAGLNIDTSGNVTNAFVAYDDTTKNKVTLGGTSGTTITNLAAGAVNAASTDAINGAQLYNTANSTAAALGGGSAANADGSVKRPSYNIAGGTYNDVGSALAAVDAKAAAGSIDGVKYDTSAHDRVTFSGARGTVLSNVSAGAFNTDAVNVGQLKAAGLNIDTSGNVTNAFVAYDDTTKNKVTLGGTSGTTITNLAAGAVNAASKDAINGAQLYNTANSTAAALGGGSAANADGSVKRPSYNIAGGTYNDVGSALAAVDAKAAAGSIDGVKYDTSAHDRVTFSGARGTVLTNVSAGALDADAVNVAQLKAAGLNIDTSGNVTNAFVAYDDATQGKVTLGGGVAGTVIANLADGAVNAMSREAINGSQLYGTANSVARALGGGAAVNTDGSVSMPKYTVGGDSVNGVEGAVNALDTRITQATDGIAEKVKYIKFGDTVAADASASGVNSVAIGGFAMAQGDNALAIGANSRAMATNSVAIGAGSSTSIANTFAVGSNTSKRRVVNVADAVNASDAVTLGQMNAAIASALPANGTQSLLKSGAVLRSAAAPLAATSVGATSASDTSMSATSVGALQAAPAVDNLAYDGAAHDRVTLGGTDGTTRVALTNLQDATLSEASSDAVTGAQLYATNQQLATLGNAVQNYSANGSTSIAANTTSGPALATGSGSFAAGGGASASGNDATALGDRAQAAGKASVALGSQAKASANNAVAIGANAVADRDNTVSVGAAGSERQIVNVAAGVEGNDAVNVNQLNSAVAHAGQQMAGLQSQINSVAKSANAGTAAAMAVAGLPQATDAGKAMVAVAGSRYGGQSGAAFGASYVTQNNRFVVKLSGNTSSNGNVGVVAGAGFQW